MQLCKYWLDEIIIAIMIYEHGKQHLPRPLAKVNITFPGLTQVSNCNVIFNDNII